MPGKAVPDLGEGSCQKVIAQNRVFTAHITPETVVDTLFHMVVVDLAKKDSAPIIARTIIARISPYSTAVAAFSSPISLENLRIASTSPLEGTSPLILKD